MISSAIIHAAAARSSGLSQRVTTSSQRQPGRGLGVPSAPGRPHAPRRPSHGPTPARGAEHPTPRTPCSSPARPLPAVGGVKAALFNTTLPIPRPRPPKASGCRTHAESRISWKSADASSRPSWPQVGREQSRLDWITPMIHQSRPLAPRLLQRFPHQAGGGGVPGGRAMVIAAPSHALIIGMQNVFAFTLAGSGVVRFPR